MSTIINTLQEIIRQELRAVRISELGIVEEVYPHSGSNDNDNYGCDVRLKNSGLLLRRVPVATGHIGTAVIPNVDDLVILTFDKGDINQPVIIGRLYNDADRPPLNTTDEVIFRLPLAEADNKTIMASIRNHQDDSPPREVILEMPPKMTVRITDGTVRATAGQTELKLDNPNAGGGTVTVVAGSTKITMNQDGDVTIEAAGAMEIKSMRDMTLEGLNVKIKAQANVDIEANAIATFKGNAMAKVEGSGIANIKGGLVQVQGTTMFSP